MSGNRGGSWLGVACAEHVRRGRSEGFMQLCHGKAAPLRRIQPGDTIIYYSPTNTFRGKDRLQSFTAIGRVIPGEPYPFEGAGDFRPYRRDVDWQAAAEASIEPLLDQLDLTRGQKNWGYQLRFGLLRLTDHDRDLIAAAMRATLPERSREIARFQPLDLFA
ncbi:EVE domain-containing protein [Microvirga rosea]|uniref:EVE domain-containing protein n=1 Tax=Microvirga rosea TaxID=2715425 RepID=UPI001D09C3C6|nr:EVE domain-containing protein [Microvirga rosea]MCB8823102.1 EVE domain-containing protein [Microvirga rosea]